MAITNPNVPSITSDLVAIYDDETGFQVFGEARPVKISSESPIKFMKNPVATGGNITDHFIIEPDFVSIDFVIPNFNYRDVYQQVRTSANEGRSFTVQTKVNTYLNMRIENYPIEEDPGKFNAIVMTIPFVEIQFDTAQVQILPAETVSNAADSTTIDRGQQSTTETSGSVALQAAQDLGAVN